MEKREFSAEVGKVLNLVINTLYTDKDIFLRELISNASDALDKRRHEAVLDATVAEQQFKISVILDKVNKTITIRDNGIGMNKEDLIANLGTIANSGTQKFMEALAGSANRDVNLIGQFGVGFYSAFMVASEVKVFSRKIKEEQSWLWTSDGTSIFSIAECDQQDYGTTIILSLKSEDEKYLDKYYIRHIITTYSDHISFPIELLEVDSEAEIVNHASAIWMRPKEEISEEQYNEFYHHVAHQPDTPWMRMHQRLEGAVEYTSLLYIPSAKPFDLFHPDRKTRIKLYIKRVFITDDISEIVPRYLRFMRGVIDSEDLPLNISRQTVQSSPIMSKIRKSLVKKVLSELKNKLKSDAADYDKFWNNFGEVLKEGLCEPVLEEKELLLEVCRFRSTTSDNLITLDEYVDRMPGEQNCIYYITGNDIENLRAHPSLEGFQKKGIEVLLLDQYVDEFWVNVVNQYKNKEIKNINTSAEEIENAIKEEEENQEATPANTETLVDFIKNTLGDSVAEVRVTKKLVASAACLAIPEGYMTTRMERMLIEQKQLNKPSAKILEINPKHFMMQKIQELMQVDKQKASDIAFIVYDQACILEGENVRDPQAFVKRVNALIESAK